MTHISDSLFKQVADEIVPKLRAAVEEIGLPLGTVSSSLAMTADVKVDGVFSRVRVQVTLDPDDLENEDDEEA